MSYEYYDDIPDEVREGETSSMKDEVVDEVEQIMRRAEERPIEASNIDQITMLSYLATSKTAWIMAAPIIKPEYFDPENRKVVKYLSRYYHKHSNLPSLLHIRQHAGVQLSLPEDADEDHAIEEAITDLETFCRNQSLIIYLHSAATMVSEHNNQMSRAAVDALLKRADEISRISVRRDLGFEIHDDPISKLKETEKYVGIPTGLEFFDMVMDGGVTQPSLNIVSAASGDGKSIFLQNMAVIQSEKYLKNVLFYTLELEPESIMQRFAAMVTKTHVRLVIPNLYSVGKQMEQHKEGTGQIWLQKFPMVGTTVADIAAHYNDMVLETGKQWDVVCIDYIDVMTPIERIDKANIHLKDKFVSEEMNDFAHQNKLIVWTASQQTKGAQDEKDARQSGVAGGSPKVHTCDNLIILKRSEDDRQEKRVWAHFKKARSSGGVNTQVPMYWDDPGTLNMSDGDRFLFEKANPILFQDIKQTKENGSNKINSDPLVRESEEDIVLTAKPSSKKEKKASDTLTSLRDRLKSKDNDGKQIGDAR